MGAHCSSSNRTHISKTITSTIGWSQLKWKVTADGYYMNTPTLTVKLHWSMPTTTNHTLAGEEVEIASHPPELFLQPEQKLSLSFNIQTFEDVCWCCMGRTITYRLLISMTTSAVISLPGGAGHSTSTRGTTVIVPHMDLGNMLASQPLVMTSSAPWRSYELEHCIQY